MTTAFYEDTATIVADPFEPLHWMDGELWDKEGTLGEYLSDAKTLMDEDIKFTDYDYSLFRMKMHQFSFVSMGLDAYRMKVSKCYKDKYPSFANFCKQELGYSPWQINNMIDGARVVNTLIAHGFEILPKNEAQTRELRRYFGSELAALWKEVIKAVPHHKLTAKTIREIRDLGKEKEVVEDPTVKQEMSAEAYYWLKQAAEERGVSRTEMLDLILIPDYDTETIVSASKSMRAMAESIEDLGGFDAAKRKVEAIY